MRIDNPFDVDSDKSVKTRKIVMRVVVIVLCLILLVSASMTIASFVSGSDTHADSSTDQAATDTSKDQEAENLDPVVARDKVYQTDQFESMSDYQVLAWCLTAKDAVVSTIDKSTGRPVVKSSGKIFGSAWQFPVNLPVPDTGLEIGDNVPDDFTLSWLSYDQTRSGKVQINRWPIFCLSDTNTDKAKSWLSKYMMKLHKVASQTSLEYAYSNVVGNGVGQKLDRANLVPVIKQLYRSECSVMSGDIACASDQDYDVDSELNKLFITSPNPTALSENCPVIAPGTTGPISDGPYSNCGALTSAPVVPPDGGALPDNGLTVPPYESIDKDGAGEDSM